MKLGKRLKQIDTMVSSEYTHIWDSCCDHGGLGASLLSRNAAPYIHFVDVVPELMSELTSKLQRYFAHSESQWSTHCLDVKTLPLTNYHGKQLVIIAGVGGQLMAEMVDELIDTNPMVPIDFILCPVHHHHALRKKLIELDFGLKLEVLIDENNRFYEIMLVASDASDLPKVSPVGDSIWKVSSEEQLIVAKMHLKNILDHYKRIQKRRPLLAQPIIDAYQSVTI